MRYRVVAACLACAPVVGLLVVTSTGSATAGKRTAATTVTITLDDYSVHLSRVTVPVGARVRFVAVNAGQVRHEAVLERAGARNHPLQLGGERTEIEGLGPRVTRSAVWRLTARGDYQIACHVPGHYQRGMVATLHVR
jgi:uncharacterized cupredoxin-like copper-binding protein